MDSLQSQITDELRRIIPVIEEYTGLMQTPIRDRYSLLLDISRALPQERKVQALFVLSRANAEFRNPSYVQF